MDKYKRFMTYEDMRDDTKYKRFMGRATDMEEEEVIEAPVFDFDTPALDKIKKLYWLDHRFYTLDEEKDIQSLLGRKVWITARKEKLYVDRMDTTHIQNCILCLEGRGKTIIPPGYLGGKDKWMEIFRNELAKRQ